MITGLANTIFAGRFNDAAKLAGVGLGSSTNEILCMSLVVGLNGALETLVSQAYGYGNLHLCGVCLNRGRLIGTCLFIPIMVLLLFSETVLLKLGQDPDTSHYASKIIITSIPGLYFGQLFDMQKRFLNCM